MRKQPRDRTAAIKAGVMRHIVGESRVAAKRAAKAAVKAAPAAVAEPAREAVPRKAPMVVSDRALMRARSMRRTGPTLRSEETAAKVFAPYVPAPGVVPKKRREAVKLAMDEAVATANQLGAWGGLQPNGVDNLFAEGIGFLGYAYLAELTQRPEYRRISERIATEMTRKWIKLQVTSPDDIEDPIAKNKKPEPPVAPGMESEDEAEETPPEEVRQKVNLTTQGGDPEHESSPDDVQHSVAQKAKTEKAKKLQELEDELTRLKVKDKFYNMAEWDGWFGRAHLFVDLGVTDDSAELSTSIGTGRNSRGKVRRGKLRGFTCVEPMWCYPAFYNANNPLDPGFYNPQHWYVNGTEVHKTRLLTFVGREVPDILKPAYAFGGLAMSQMAKPYVDNWLRTRQAVCDLIESFSVTGVYTNMSGTLQDGGDEAIKRIELFNITRSNAGAFMLDKDTEEFFNVSTPLGTLDHLQAQAQEQMSSVTGIPLVILLGITPTGLNASSEGEIRAFYDWINAYQESFFRDKLQTVIELVQLNLWGKIDEEIGFIFEPLWSMTDKEIAEIDKLEAETDQIRIDSGVLHPEEARIALANEPNSRYADINVADVPEPPADPMGEEDPFGNGGGDDEGGGGDNPGGDKPEGAQDERPYALFPEGAFDSWNESDHPRSDDGKFGSGSGGSSTSGNAGGSSKGTKGTATAKSEKGSAGASSSSPALNVAQLKQQGGKLGSNAGGTYTDDAGKKYYIKKPASKAHVDNELAAARLYQLAGVQTLNYRDVEGGGHVATEWASLDKNNISKFTAAEKKAAAADFAIHAWLSNWDAAGLGGDNQGILAGKPATLDVGGSLRFRAQGSPKGAAFGNKVTELDTLRDKKMNPDAAGLFGSMSDTEMKSSVERVTSIPDEAIRKAVGSDTELADTLIARKRDMAKRFGMAHDEAPDELVLKAALDAQPMLATAANSGSPVVLPGDDEDEDEEDVTRILFASDEDPEEVAPDVFAMDDASFDESKHKRDSDGKFSSTGGGGAGGKPDDGKSSEAAKVFKTKKDHIAHLLQQGTTPKELMQTMGWPSVSMPAQAKSLGMKLEKKDGKYYGTKMTDAELAAAKESDKSKAIAKSGKSSPETLPGSTAGVKKEAELPADIPAGPKQGKPPQNYSEFLGAIAEAAQTNDIVAVEGLLKYNPEWAKQFMTNATPKGKETLEKLMPGIVAMASGEKPKPKVPQATPEELKKASKTTSLPMTASSPGGGAIIKDFNEKYAGKPVEGEALNQKVQDYKDMQTAVKKADAEYAAATQAEKAAAQKKLQEQAEAKAKAEKEAKQKELDAKFAADPELKTHYEAMEAMFGGGTASAGYLASAKAKLVASGLQEKNPQIRAEDVVPIVAYSGSHYVEVNNQLRSGKMTAKQYAFSKSLNAGLDKLPAHTKTTYRKASLTPEQASLYEPGFIIEERGFMSTSKSQKTWSGSHQFIVHGKGGRDISKLSSHPGEAEVLFKSGSRFEVVSKDGTTITLKEV